MHECKKVVWVMGDVHGDFAALNDFLNKKIRCSRKMRELAKTSGVEAIVLQCGDFGYFWPGEHNSGLVKNQADFLKDGHAKIYWCAGNHEDHARLASFFPAGSEADSTNVVETDPGLFFCRFGATLDLGPNTRVLFAGGAESNDKEYRVEGESWWPEESVDEADLARLPDCKVDWVVSHTAPCGFRFDLPEASRPEPSREMLDLVLRKYSPKRWFFGHFHHYMEGHDCGCDWTCLNYVRSHGRYWQKVDPDQTSEKEKG